MLRTGIRRWLAIAGGLSLATALSDGRPTRAGSSAAAAVLREAASELIEPSSDVSLYYFTASQLLGKPYLLSPPDRGTVPDTFSRPPLASDGRWHTPYREVPFEYPPIALALIVTPRLIADDPRAYNLAFEFGMACMLACAAALVLSDLPVGARRGCVLPCTRARRGRAMRREPHKLELVHWGLGRRKREKKLADQLACPPRASLGALSSAAPSTTGKLTLSADDRTSMQTIANAE